MAREYEGIARALASKGRYGDSMLMHVNPAEVEALQRYAPGGITINPDTGQPEAFLPLLVALGPLLTAATTAGGLSAASLAAPAMTAALAAAAPAAATTGATLGATLGSALPTALAEAGASAFPVALETGAGAAAETLGTTLGSAVTDVIPNIGAGLGQVAETPVMTAAEAAVAEATGEAVGQTTGEFLGEYAVDAGVEDALAQVADEATAKSAMRLDFEQAIPDSEVWASGVSDSSTLPINEGLINAPEYLIKGFQDAPLANILEGAKEGVKAGGEALWNLPLEKQIMLGSLAAGAGTMIAEEAAGDEGPPKGWDSDEDPGPSSYAGPASWSGDITGDPSGPAPWAGDITGEASPPFSPAGGGLISPGFDPSDSPYVQSGDLGIPEEGIFGTEASPLLESPDLSGYESPPGVYETGGEGLGALAEAVEPLGGGIAEGIPEGMDIGEVMAGFEELKSGLGMTDITIEEYIAMLNQQSYGGLAYG
jgi:hypothetical protein